MKTHNIFLTCVAVLLLTILWAPDASAYEQYSTARTSGNCADCHGGFRAPYTSLADGFGWGDDLHDVHRNTMLSGDCSTCHSGGGRFPVLLNSSSGGSGLDPISCSGCHGRAETAAGGQVTGAGLRQHHWNSGEQVCLDCHDDANPALFTVVGENVLPPYYFTPDAAHPNKPTDPCNPLGEENYKGSAIGLDNDGDGLYDQADPDCLGNSAPVANNDAYSTNENTILSVSAPGVLGNDTDADGDALSAVLDTNVSNGTLALNSAGGFVYTPNIDFNGSDSFTYHANDGTVDSNIATVTITVNAVNDAPVAADDAYTTDEDVTLNVPAPGVLGNDTDADGDALSAVLNAGPASGSLTLNADGSFSYTPNANFNGSDSFSYVANDGTVNSNIATVTITVNAVNDAPVADPNGPYTGTAGLPVSFNGLGSSDVDGNIAAYDWNFGDGNTGTGPAPTHTYAAEGIYTVTLTVTDDGTPLPALSSAAVTTTATIAAAPNVPPAAVADIYTTDEDTVLNVPAPGVLGNDIDVDGDPLTAVLDTGPGNGTLTLNANGSFSYTPSPNFNGVDSFTYHVNDGLADSSIVPVTITVNAVNDAPVAADDAYTTDEDVTLNVAAPGVLGNDTDVDGVPLSAVLNAGPGNGTLTLNANGSFSYTPNANFNGSDSFSYVANDGTVNSNIATVTITVNAVNDAPVATDDAYTTNEDTPLSVPAPGVLGNDTDADGDALSAALNAGPGNGTLTLNANGSFSYTPNANFNGSDSFSYVANDGTVNSNIATVTITVNAVNDTPVAVDDAYTTDEDVTLNVAAPGVLGNDSDADGDALTAALNAGPASGSLTLNADGSFSYTPNANFNGSDSFSYVANDGTVNSNIATVTITVNAVNNAPVATDDAYTTNEDTPLSVPAPGVLGNDTDADGDALSAALNAGPGNGTLTLNANGSFSYTPNANFNGSDSFSYVANDGTVNSNIATVTITVNAVNDTPVAVDDAYTTDEDVTLNVAAPGVLGNDSDADGDALTAALNAGPGNGTLTLNANGSFSYTPNANFNGSDSFSYVANDGTVNSNIATVTITVNAVNNAPVATDDAYTTNEDTPLSVPAPGVLGNDTDADGDALSAVLNAGPGNGTLTLNADGSFSYTPNANFNGSDSFSYVANDGTVNSNIATVTITVNAVNDAPVAVDDAYTTDEDVTLNVAAPGVLGNDSDADGDALTAALNAGPGNGTLTLNADGSFSYTPNANFNGSDSFTYHANDGTADSNIATVTITVNAVNNAPVAADDAYTTDEDTPLSVPAPGVLGNDTDADGDALSAVLNAGPGNGTLALNADGSFSYTPNANFNGSDSFSYVANDGTADSNIATVTITVNAVNDAPVAVDDAYTTDEDVTLNVAAPGVLGNDSDADGDALTAALNAGPGNGTLTLNADGSFSYTPNANFNGSDSFSYVANDGTVNSNIATVTITVNAVNNAPVATDDAYTTNEDTPLNVPAPGVLGNDTDADGDTLSAVLNAGPASGSLTLNADGSFSYTPNANFNGSDSFSYVANDGTADSNIATVTITVNAVNDAPVAVDDAYTTDEDVTLNVAAPGVLGNDSDADGDALTAALNAGPGNGTLTLNADGSFSYTPNANFNGSDSFTYHANDGTADSNIATVTITVNAVNNAPVATDDAYTTNEDTPLSVTAPGVLGNDTDADGDALSAVLNAGPGNGTLALNADGSFSYTPNANFNGSDSFSYVANDGTVNSNIATVTITVNAVNDAPVADPNGPYTGSEGVPLTLDGSGSSDVDGTIVTYDWDFGDSNTGTGVNPTHTYAAAGTYTVTLTVTDDGGLTDTATTTADIGAVNDAPVATDDAYTTDEDVTLNVPAPGVLANDSDADGDTLTAVLLAAPVNGTLALNANGSFSYTPNANFNGSDTFRYVANDGQVDSNIATVTITVNAVNDAPVADPNGPYTGSEGVPVSFDGSGSSDVDGSIASYDWEFGDGVSGSGVSPTHSYASTGTYTVTLTVTDNDGLTDSASTTAMIQAIAVDLDIEDFKVKKDVRLGEDEAIGIKLKVENNGEVEGNAQATVIGMQNGMEIYNQTMMVSDAIGDGDTKFKFPSYTPINAGDIMWTVTIADGDPDVDVATATTKVKPADDDDDDDDDDDEHDH